MQKAAYFCGETNNSVGARSDVFLIDDNQPEHDNLLRDSEWARDGGGRERGEGGRIPISGRQRHFLSFMWGRGGGAISCLVQHADSLKSSEVFICRQRDKRSTATLG